MIRKVVITAAGIGTRLLTVTKEQPKEMLPLFMKNENRDICVKPLLQIIFEQLYNSGFREVSLTCCGDPHNRFFQVRIP